MKPIVIFDLDGCLSDDRHRLHLLPQEPDGDESFEAYHDECHLDEPINRVVLAQYEPSKYSITFFTARPETYLLRTRRWIQNKLGLQHFDLWMRRKGDTTPSPLLKSTWLRSITRNPDNVACAYDDRNDVLNAYRKAGVSRVEWLTYPAPSVEHPVTVADLTHAAAVMRGMADTFEERNALYKDNYKRVAPIMAQLFPDGAKPDILHLPHFHLLELVVVKLTRYAASEMKHADSIHDAGLYCAMIEASMKELES